MTDERFVASRNAPDKDVNPIDPKVVTSVKRSAYKYVVEPLPNWVKAVPEVLPI